MADDRSPTTDHRLFAVDGLSQTEALGRRLGGLLFPGAVVGLVGPLGAGKTHFVRAVAEGLGVPDPRAVSSPTFVLIQEYHGGRLPIYHFDTYRLPTAEAFADLGVHEYFAGDGVCLVEWADKFEPALPAERLWVEIEPVGADGRRFRVTAAGARYADLLGRLAGP